MAITIDWKQRSWITTLVVFNIASAMAVAFGVHVSRNIVGEIQGLKIENDALEVEWGRLLLEKSAWGSYTRIEKIANEQLKMEVPEAQNVIMVSPR